MYWAGRRHEAPHCLEQCLANLWLSILWRLWSCCWRSERCTSFILLRSPQFHTLNTSHGQRCFSWDKIPWILDPLLNFCVSGFDMEWTEALCQSQSSAIIAIVAPVNVIYGARKSCSCAIKHHKAQILQNIIFQLRSQWGKLKNTLGGVTVGPHDPQVQNIWG